MVKAQLTFWIQFLGHPEGPRVPVIEERVLRASTADEARRAASVITWPAGAHASRVNDLDGRDVFRCEKSAYR